ncbi:flippase-like domain-containing protein [Haladaptatus sp. DYF46]|uniref:lysylphosphatidylglycerol synthase transmembrane domain-containing protein n=1 Tax=Haladaptatus sp. DYF46 TaxID=2886041 RepID=UPI001E5E281A|nr:flippase-like domain-containing protein [Haladaptatus sp. DYF46]
MLGLDLRKGIIAFLIIIGVYGILFSFVGVDRFSAAIESTNLTFLCSVIGAIFGWLIAWSMALRTILNALDVNISRMRGFFVLVGTIFFNNITPFGQAGGEPVTAHLISQSTDSEYETGLAAITSFDTLNFIPSTFFAVSGVGYFLLTSTLHGVLRIAAIAVVILAVAVPSFLFVGWQRRDKFTQIIVNSLTPVLKIASRKLPWVSPISKSGMKSRIERFFKSIERVATNRHSLGLSLSYSTLGWLLQILGLWITFRAIGYAIPISVALFAVPIASIAGVTPLPGGAGAIEGVLIALLTVLMPTLGVQAITTAVIIFRGISYWVPVLLGGAVTSLFSTRGFTP